MKVESNGGWLRIRFTYQSKRHCLSLGLKEGKSNRIKAERLLLQIEADIQDGSFDSSLSRYKPHPSLKKPLAQLSCAELFTDWLEYKSRFCDARTIKWYKPTKKILEYFGDTPAGSVTKNQSIQFAAWLKPQAGAETQRRKLEAIKACWDWGIDNGYVTENPWAEVAKLIKPPAQESPTPFSSNEVELIFEGFKKLYPPLLPFVRFLFATGCRTGEARGLRWSDLSEKCDRAAITSQLTREGRRKPPKNRKTRTLWLPESLSKMLTSLKLQSASELVFTWNGKPIDEHGFYKRWSLILKNQNIPHRKPYSTRHTFISHALERGISPMLIAQQTGHNPKVLFEHYAGHLQSSPKLPEMF
ncbi:tyrosine-type recombinase/integrase [Funiculus sociatus]|uniref:tyrosine-type recombinase/integrase n=1 Tax=Funiculus sociatus TaxID=450527 RepID=UPI003298A3F0